MSTVIIVDVEHHTATKALSRIEALLDYSRDGYAVNRLDYTTLDITEMRQRIEAAVAAEDPVQAVMQTLIPRLVPPTDPEPEPEPEGEPS